MQRYAIVSSQSSTWKKSLPPAVQRRSRFDSMSIFQGANSGRFRTNARGIRALQNLIRVTVASRKKLPETKTVHLKNIQSIVANEDCARDKNYHRYRSAPFFELWLLGDVIPWVSFSLREPPAYLKVVWSVSYERTFVLGVVECGSGK